MFVAQYQHIDIKGKIWDPKLWITFGVLFEFRRRRDVKRLYPSKDRNPRIQPAMVKETNNLFYKETIQGLSMSCRG